MTYEPESIKELPQDGRALWIRTFNETMKKYKNETVAVMYAWNDVKRLYMRVKGKWAKIQSVNGTTDYKINKIERVGEDAHFVKFRTIITRTGVMDRGYKPEDEILSVPGQVPPELDGHIPGVNDHPPGGVEIRDPKLWVGFFSDLKAVKQNGKSYVEAIDNVPKSRPELIKAIEDGDVIGNSIGYMYTPQKQNGDWNGFYYDTVERGIKIYHVARMLKQKPACPPPSCGYTAVNCSELTDDELIKMWNEAVRAAAGGNGNDAGFVPDLSTAEVEDAIEQLKERKTNDMVDLELKKVKIQLGKKLLGEADD